MIMSKQAEQRAIEAYPFLPTNVNNDVWDDNKEPRAIYLQGYEQAEKDLALTKDDVWTIYNLVRELQVKYSATDGCLQEVADIFNEQRNNPKKGL